MIDIQNYYKKLANKDPISESEVVDLLKELVHFRAATAYLASCQGATLESLPKSASKSSRGRHESICASAARLLSGDASEIRYAADMSSALDRCTKAVNKSRQEMAVQALASKPAEVK